MEGTDAVKEEDESESDDDDDDVPACESPAKRVRRINVRLAVLSC